MYRLFVDTKTELVQATDPRVLAPLEEMDAHRYCNTTDRAEYTALIVKAMFERGTKLVDIDMC